MAYKSIMNVAHNIEYEDAPSGNVTFYNYKEPLMKFFDPVSQSGFGFAGALVFDSNSGQIQCHFCGNWFNRLETHIRKEHSLTTDDYKRVVGLTKKSALIINENIRAKLIEHGRSNKKNRLNLRPGTKHSEATREKIRATLKEHRDEMKNLKGTCPEQLIDRLRKLHDKLGRTPILAEIPFIEALETTYGSMKEACMVAGIPYRKPGQNVTYASRGKYPKEKCIEAVFNFLRTTGRLPIRADWTDKKEWTAILQHGKEEVFKKALVYDGIYRKQEDVYRFDKESLLDFMRRFKEINDRFPSTSDCKRGLLPHASRYIYHFKSWRGALEAAFPGVDFGPKPRIVKKEKPRLTVDQELRRRFRLNQKKIRAKQQVAV